MRTSSANQFVFFFLGHFFALLGIIFLFCGDIIKKKREVLFCSVSLDRLISFSGTCILSLFLFGSNKLISNNHTMRISSLLVSLLVVDEAFSFSSLKLASPFFPYVSFKTKKKNFFLRSRDDGGSSSSTQLSMVMMGGSDLPPPQVQVPTLPRGATTGPVNVRYSDFIKLINADRIDEVSFTSDGTKLIGVDIDGIKFKIESLPNDSDLLSELTDHNVDVTILPAKEAGNTAVAIFMALFFPFALFSGMMFIGRQILGGENGPFGFGKTKSQIQLVPDTGVTFDEVAGCDGAKMELSEVVDFLKQPEAYTLNGCTIPRGVILDGPPGTGKTLLAKAVAGEAGVPFLSISGSEFVEMFVGVGASRVRDIFGKARQNAPCIIFIDEIDAVGRQRGSSVTGNDERETTINQILVEMDGFDGNPGIITIAATNRADILDQALLRPGRFDRKVTVDLPDFKGRTRILGVHFRGKPLEPDVDLEAVSRRTPGFSGAQLENLVNEAAITAVRQGRSTIGWEEIDNAIDRIMVGLEKKGGNQVAKQKELIAYHEAGHAIVGALVPDYDQVQKITIIPRSNGAGGLTFFAPQESRLETGLYSKQYLESQLAVALGGRLAEEIIYGEDMVTTGASNDIQQVASIAKRMVKDWGMSDKVGRVTLTEPSSSAGSKKIPRSLMQQRTQWGNKILGTVEEEVERLVNNSYLIAKQILEDNKDLLDHLAHTLLEQEVVSAEQFQSMLVEFKARTIDYKILGEQRNREKLPFQGMPPSV